MSLQKSATPKSNNTMYLYFSITIPHWPLPAVPDLIRDGRLGTQAVQGFIPGEMRTHGTPSKATITNKTRPAGSFSFS